VELTTTGVSTADLFFGVAVFTIFFAAVLEDYAAFFATTGTDFFTRFAVFWAAQRAF